MKIYNPYVTASIATIGGMMFGFDISSVSAFISNDAYTTYFNHPSTLTQGGITSAMPGGSFLGSLASGFLSDRFGRRPVIQAAAVIWMIGAAIQSSSQNIAQLICGRLISGVGIGFSSSQVPVYIAELSPKDIRGRLVGIFQWAVTWGILIMFLIGFGCGQINGTASFRLAWGIQIVPGAILLAGTFVLPESPRWLASQDRWEEAIDIISKVQSKGDVNNTEVLIELEEIKEVIRAERESKETSFFEMFNKRYINRTMVGIWGQIWQQLCGMNVMMYYVVFIFEMAGFSGNVNLVSGLIQYILNVAMTVPALLFIDSWGRRPLFITGGILMLTWLMGVCICLAVYAEPAPNGVDGNPGIKIIIKNNTKAAHAVIACSYLFVCSFAPTWGPGMWIYCSEIFTLKLRAKSNGVTAAANWIFNWALALFVAPAFTNLTWRTYIIFIAFCFTMTVHVYLMFPETKGKTLEEINQIWDAKIPAWRTASFVARRPSISDVRARNEFGTEKAAFEHSESENASPVVTGQPALNEPVVVDKNEVTHNEV